LSQGPCWTNLFGCQWIILSFENSKTRLSILVEPEIGAAAGYKILDYLTYLLPRFGMAEQAINTIYLLGEHPDQLCNELIKNLTRRAFSSLPQASFKPERDAMDEDNVEGYRSAAASAASAASLDSQGSQVFHGDAGDAFSLSQLIFIVGHVAIKHIVYLEFVEKEWKRQKEEREKEEKEKDKQKSEPVS
jgi:condensin complex subunit 1